MTTIRREIPINVPAAALWGALRDVGALHTRLVTGFVTDCRMDGDDARYVTFANGLEVRERIVAVDEETRRVVWSATGGRLTHHNAAVQVIAEGDRSCRAVWIADLLPDAMAAAMAPMIEAGLAAMKHTLER